MINYLFAKPGLHLLPVPLKSAGERRGMRSVTQVKTNLAFEKAGMMPALSIGRSVRSRQAPHLQADD
jgi:hypothetical protein